MPQQRHRGEVDALSQLLQKLAATFKAMVDGLTTLIASVASLITSSTETHKPDNDPFTQDTDKVDVAGFVLDEVAGPGAALTENDASFGRIDSKHAMVMVIEDPTTRGRKATVTAAGELLVSGSGSGTTGDTPSTAGAVTSVAANVASVTLLASNTSRRQASFVNDSATATAYLKLGATASTSSYTTKMRPGAQYELPHRYTGIIDCIWDIASGNMRITELT